MEEIELPQARRLPRGRPFAAGRSRPGGRPASGGRATAGRSPPRCCFEGEAEALTRKAVERALAGDPTALRLCLERLLPPCRERAIKVAAPPIESAADIAPAMNAVLGALAGGIITPAETQAVAHIVDTLIRAIDASDFEQRLAAIEKITAADRQNPAGYRYG